MIDTISTMKLNHLSFPTSDLPATAEFFEKHLGFTIAQKVGEKYYILKRPGFDVVIEAATDVKPDWPGTFHIGFELPSAEEVRRLYDRFKADGVHLETDIFNNDRGSRFFCRAPGGVMFELNTRADASEEYRGTFDN